MNKLFMSSRYNSHVKLKGFTSKQLIPLSHEYNSSLKLKSVSLKNQNVLTAKFNELTFTKIDCLYYLENGFTGNKLSVSPPIFKCYFINQDYSEIFIANEVGVYTHYGWQCYFNLDLLLPDFIEGQAAIKITVDTKRLDEKIRASVYLNHLGIYDSITRLRNDLDFLDITKLDE